MALQRKNFRCPRDGLSMSPLKSNPLTSTSTAGVVISHAELPPRQRKRVQVGSTNLFRNASTPELPSVSASVSSAPAPAAVSSPDKTSNSSTSTDVSSATHRICETNLALIKSSMHDTLSRRHSAATASPGLVVLSEKRRLKELTKHVPLDSRGPHDPDNNSRTPLGLSSATRDHRPDVSNNNDNDDNMQTGPRSMSTSASRSTVERAFFLETRKTLFNAFVDRYGSVRAVFKAFDRDANGRISYQRFVDMVDASQVGLSPSDVQRVFRHVDTNGDNSIEYHEFSQMFTASEYVEHASAYSPSKAHGAAVDPTNSLSLKFRAPLDLSPRSRERMKELRLKVNGELLHKHGRDVSVYGGKTGKTENLLVYAFKQVDTDNDGFLSYGQVKCALGKDVLQLAIDAAEMDEMVRMIDRNADELISMKEFVQYFGAGERELPTDLIDNARRKELAALHVKATAPLTPRHEVDPAFFARREAAAAAAARALDASVALSLGSLDVSSGCLQENLAQRVATSPVFRRPPPSQSKSRSLTTSPSMPSLARPVTSTSTMLTKSDLGPTLHPLVAVSQDRHAYWREQRTDWTRVGVGGDGVRTDAALFGDPHERFETTAARAFSPMRRGVHSGDVCRDEPSTSEREAHARAVRRQAKHAHTQALVTSMEAARAQQQRVSEWTQRAKVRRDAERRYTYVDAIHDAEQRVAMREQQMAKRHGGARFHRMWAGSADSQFNNTHVTGGTEAAETHINQ